MEYRTRGQVSKVVATAFVWGFATGMLGICIPLVSVTQSGVVLPAIAILGASVSTIAIWLSSQQSIPENSELTKEID
ncbi:hypothetical protein IQ249_09025 [Lusitaniella coriacea LEGE 07157]|uniref:Uncharacterized protein n=1 Tax=Lusitaniella coriacea LEGE 07157 TaxID=945747 RepID=A0A8J7J874_9CYAN|nr:hypothetical protein [Lusitaniella coriacea]MBE9116035.1 hypothetical protein [Lusitaniella coriacea LEGE 07157]